MGEPTGPGIGSGLVSLSTQQPLGPSLRWLIWVGAWNVFSLWHDDCLPPLLRGFCKLCIFVAAISEVRRPGSGLISEGGCTIFWTACCDDGHTQGVAAAGMDWLLPTGHQVGP